MTSVFVAKCLSVVIIFAGSLICGLLPAFRVFSAFPRFGLSLILSYGGGILIATSLVHILPEARESWPDIAFTPEMSLCIGIFIVYFVEELAHFLVCHDLHSPLGHHAEEDNHTHGVHVHHEEPPNRCDEPAAVYLFAEEKTRSGDHGHGHSHSHSHLNNSNLGMKLPDSDEQKDDKKEVAVKRLRSLVGLMALSIHAGLEGLSVGLGRDASDVFYLCGAVAAHKFVISFCLGVEVKNASSSPCTLVSTSSSSAFKVRYVLFFALMTPLGIAIGTTITEILQDSNPNTESTLVAVLQTLASGTLLYVAFFEVVLRERARFSGRGLAQLALVILGFATMSLIEIFVGGHNHSSHHCHDEHLNSTTEALLGSLNDTNNCSNCII